MGSAANREADVITYTASFRYLKKTVLARALDFPGVVTEGNDLAHARDMLADALVTMAESYVKDGSAFPIPNPKATDPDSDLEEPIFLLFNASNAVKIVPQEVLV